MITDPLEVEGPGASTLSISGNGQTNRIFAFTPSASGNQLEISGLTLKDAGGDGDGGAIVADYGGGPT